MKILIPLFVLISLSAYAQDDELLTDPGPENSTPVLTTTPPDDTEKELLTPPNPEVTTPVLTSSDNPDKIRVFNPRKGHLITTFGFEGLKYEVPFDFRSNNNKKNFHPGTQDLFGARFGLGAEIYIGGGLNTTSKIEGYYVGTLFTKKRSADPDVPDVEEYAYYKKTGGLYGVDVAQSLGYLIDMKTYSVMGTMVQLTFEPFAEIGAGMAKAYNAIAYNYETSFKESYRLRVSDDLLVGRIGGGFNIISGQGYFLHVKITQAKYDITKRKLAGRTTQSDGTTFSHDGSDNDVKIDPITTFIIGGGYKF